MNSDLEIVSGLGSPVAEERRAAIERIESIGSGKALKVLLAALADERHNIRRIATDALKLYPDKVIVLDSLLSLLGETSDANTRNSAIEVFEAMGKSAMATALRGMKSQDPRVRKLCADVLGKIPDREAELKLINSLKDEDENVRLAAAEGLGNFKSADTLESLTALLAGSDMALKFCALESLAGMDVEIDIELIKVLIDHKILRRAAFDALSTSSKAEAVKLLAAGLHDTSHSSRNAAIRGLGKLYFTQPHLKKVVVDELRKRHESDDLIEVLVGALDDANPDVKRGGVRLLGAAGYPSVLLNLIEAARDSELQGDAYSAIKTIVDKHPEALEKNLPPVGDPLRDLLMSINSGSPYAIKAPPGTFKPRTAEMTPAQFASFRNHVHEFCGIYFKDEMKFLLEKRLFRRLEILQIPTFGEYLDMVMNTIEGRKEIREAINVLTTNETYFFREKFQLRALAEEIMPEVREKKLTAIPRRLRILSAGCSSGEEPYTVAIIIAETGLFNGWDVRITGCDIADKVLERARHGVYNQSAFRSTPPEYLERYFSKINADEWLIEDSIRDKVDFERTNLFDSHDVESLAPFDIILCRNVIIYFDMEAKKKVIDNLYRALDPGGFLLLGHSESLININTRFELVHLKNDMVYRKPIPKNNK